MRGKIKPANTTATRLLLRRRRLLLVPQGTAAVAQPLEMACSFNRNLESLGFTCSNDALEALRRLTERELTELHVEVVKELRELVGATVTYSPMYPNFPAQVMAAQDVELYLNALMHYLGDLVGARILPMYEKAPRVPLNPSRPLSLIELAADGDVEELGRQLLGARTSLSKTDKCDVLWFVLNYKDKLEAIFPKDELGHKENLAFLAAALIEHTDKADVVLNRYFRTATDVLRLAAGLSKQDVSLAENPAFGKIPRRQRRSLLALLERCAFPREDMQRHREKWLRLGERLHPGEMRARFPRAAEAFDQLRGGERFRGFASCVEQALAKRDVTTAIAQLSKRPGELVRRLDQLMRMPSSGAEVVSAFADVAKETSVAVLLQTLAHFQHRMQKKVRNQLRVFVPKGQVGKLVAVPDELPPLDVELVRAVIDVCRVTLIHRFQDRAPLGKVWVDPALQDYFVPLSQRSASKSLRTLVRGSRLPMPDASTLRFFLWWKEGKIEGKDTGRVDIDLSAALYSADWRYLEHVSYTHLRSAKYRACHSGDITSAPNGACEFIDFEVGSVAAHARYLVPCVFSYTSHPFANLPECFAGWMARSEPNSGEIFEPSTVVDRIDLSAGTRICAPAVFDLVKREIIWADLALKAREQMNTNLESNTRGLVHLARGLLQMHKPDLHELFTLHARARGALVASAAMADRVYAPKVIASVPTTTPFDVEEIMSAYL